MRTLVLSILLLCIGTMQAQTVIENPKFKVRSGSINNITKIERTPECTKLYIHAIFRPGWWIMVEKDHYLQDVATGKTYPITGAEGITFNKKTTMPKSGSMDFVLLFAPLPKGTQTIHWITPNDAEGNFYDISLNTKKSKTKKTLFQQIQGNWFTRSDRNDWAVGFYDTLAIVQNRMYTYKNIEIKDARHMQITLKDKENGNIRKASILIPKEGYCDLVHELGMQQQLTRTEIPEKVMAEEDNFTRFIRPGKACIQGYIDGYDTRLELKSGMIYLSNTVTREDYPTVVIIRPDGSFRCEFDLEHPIEENLIFDRNYIPFYIEPGQTLTLYINWEDILNYSRKRDSNASIENIQYMGPSAEISVILKTQASLFSKVFKDRIPDLQKRFTPEQFQLYMQPRIAQWTQITDSLCNLHKHSRKAVHLMRNKLKIEEAYTLLDFLSFRSYYTKDNPDNQALQAKEEPSYYDFLKEFPLNDETILADERMDIFINRFEYMSPLEQIYRTNSTITLPDSIRFTYPKKGVLSFLKEKGVKLTPTQEKMRQRDELLAGHTVTIAPKDLIAEQKLLEELFKKEEALVKEYAEQVQTEIKQVQAEIKKEKEEDIKREILEEALSESRKKDSIIAIVCGEPMPLIWQIAKVRNLKFQLDVFNDRDMAAQHLKEIKKSLTHPFMLAEADWQFNKLYPKQEEATYKLPNSEAAKVFRRIIRNHPGKVLFVDFWATTCGPCRAGIEATANLRKQYHNHPEFQFIYITNKKESPKDDYTKYVEKNLKGEVSYYLDEIDFHYLRQLFHFNGIPHYELVEKDGSISKKNMNTHDLSTFLKERFGEQKPDSEKSAPDAKTPEKE